MYIGPSYEVGGHKQKVQTEHNYRFKSWAFASLLELVGLMMYYSGYSTEVSYKMLLTYFCLFVQFFFFFFRKRSLTFFTFLIMDWSNISPPFSKPDTFPLIHFRIRCFE